MAETCANCGRTIGKLEAGHIYRDQIVCAACIQRLATPAPEPAEHIEAELTPAEAMAQAAAAPQKSATRRSGGGPKCQLCGGRMVRKVKSSGNCLGIALALIIFVVGIVIFFMIPVIGWVIGPLICLCALFIGGKRSKVWQCVRCKAVAARG